MSQQKIRTFLWYDHQAEEAASLYISLFQNSKITNVIRYTDAGPGPASSVMTVEFELAGIQFVALNGGPHFQFTEAISLSVDCESQAEIDELWEKLSAPGSQGQCGWLKDKYGLSWQIVPSILPKLLSDPKTAGRVLPVMMQMTKLDIAVLQRAAEAK
jgi:predicted 3-demethylubiquinone-9 3-methyltransferase (glyoxalase superfamily)